MLRQVQERLNQIINGAPNDADPIPNGRAGFENIANMLHEIPLFND